MPLSLVPELRAVGRASHGRRSRALLRGYGYQGDGHVAFTKHAPGFGQACRQRVHDGANSLLLWAFSEVLGRWDNFVDVHPNVSGTYDILVLRFHVTHGENVFALLKDAVIPQHGFWRQLEPGTLEAGTIPANRDESGMRLRSPEWARIQKAPS